MAKITRILVPTDFSESSKIAAEYAISLAEKFNATIDILYVWEQPYYFDSQLILHTPGQTAQTIADFVEAQAKEEMKKFIASLSAPASVPIQDHFVHGIVYNRIIETAEKGPCDLIVMGTHGRTGVSRLVIGSVAEKVLRHAHCPVITMRSPSKE